MAGYLERGMSARQGQELRGRGDIKNGKIDSETWEEGMCGKLTGKNGLNSEAHGSGKYTAAYM